MSTDAAAATSTTPRKTPLLQSRLGSFLAVVPLSIWVVNHLWDNLSAFSALGANPDQGAAWQEAVTGYSHPFAQAFTFFIVMAPLILHTGWGIVRLFSFQPNLGRYPNYGNLKYIVQRVTAVGLFFFLGAHLFLAFLRPRFLDGTPGTPEAFMDIAREMRFHGPTLFVYLIGTMATAYHLANGLQGFAMNWGLLASERSMRRFEPVAIGLFLVLTAMAWGAIYALYQAGAAFGPGEMH